MKYLVGFIYTIVYVLVMNKFVLGIKVVGAIGEWALTIVLLNFFVFMNLFNDFYDSVHPVGKLVHPTKPVVSETAAVEEQKYTYEPISEDILPIHTVAPTAEYTQVEEKETPADLPLFTKEDIADEEEVEPEFENVSVETSVSEKLTTELVEAEEASATGKLILPSNNMA